MATRDEWSKRVQRWRDSGLTASEYASEVGINVGSLRHWSYVLGSEARQRGAGVSAEAGGPRSPRPSAAAHSASPSLPLVELSAVSSTKSQPEQFELELARGRRLHIPVSFEAASLRRLLDVLEAA